MFDLTGKTALVTGATGGIGAEIAKTLHAQGAHVVLSGTREAVLQELAAALGGGLRGAANSERCGGGGRPDRGRRGPRPGTPLDILVANAGHHQGRPPDADEGRGLGDRDQGQPGELFPPRAGAMRGMMKRRHGRIIGITSVVGVMGNPGQANYAPRRPE
jgi:3-oxoacyl-[acyl-carrier protein] reductase